MLYFSVSKKHHQETNVNILKKLEAALIAGNRDAIALAIELLGTVKIFSMTEDQVERLMAIIKANSK